MIVYNKAKLLVIGDGKPWVLLVWSKSCVYSGKLEPTISGPDYVHAPIVSIFWKVTWEINFWQWKNYSPFYLNILLSYQYLFDKFENLEVLNVFFNPTPIMCINPYVYRMPHSGCNSPGGAMRGNNKKSHSVPNLSNFD